MDPHANNVMVADFHNETSGALGSFLHDNLLFSEVQNKQEVIVDSQYSVGDFLKKSGTGGPLDGFSPSPVQPFSAVSKRN